MNRGVHIQVEQAPPCDAAFDLFFSEQFPPLVRYLRVQGACDEDAQDVAQESLFKLVRYRGNPDRVLKALLYRIALNGLCDARRRDAGNRGAHHVSLDAGGTEIPSETPQPEQRAEQQQELVRVRDALGQLPQRCREIYLLNRIDGMSYSEISRHCGISVKAVEKHISKALASLRRQLTSLPSANHGGHTL